MNSLFARLSLFFLLLLCILGAFILWLADRSAKDYFLEFTQSLNAPIAMYIAQNAELLKQGQFDQQALATLAGHTMDINPSLEVYFLDSEGAVQAPEIDPHPNTPNATLLSAVDLQPIKKFINGEAFYPLFGDNPRNAEEKRTFSAHPLDYSGQRHGYVYVVLGGEKHSNLLERVSSSYVLKDKFLVAAIVLMFSLLAGFVVFFLLTRRLQQLTKRVKTMQRQEPEGDSWVSSQALHSKDELGKLAAAYDDMVSDISSQYSVLQRSDRSRRELYANISHDMRTPLTALSGYLETLRLKKTVFSNSELTSYIDIAYRQSLRLQGLVAQLFELSHINTGELRINPEQFSVIELVHDIALDFQIRLDEGSITLSISPVIGGGDHFDVIADICLIHRVFENLIDNAIGYTPAGGDIEIAVSRLQHQVAVSISDSGQGVDMAAIDSIFERYSSDRKDRPTNSPVGITPERKELRGVNSARAVKHAGLGLSIVRGILELHHCDIQVSRRKEGGTQFRFVLPAARSHHEVTGTQNRISDRDGQRFCQA